MNEIIPLSKLKRGEQAIIISIDNTPLGLKLMEMGCMPGEEVQLKKVAPLGDPISVRIGNYVLSLRKSDAAAVQVRRIHIDAKVL